MKNGIVHYRNISTSMFVIKLDDGTYSVFESFIISSFNVGDVISGHLDKMGIYELFNVTTKKYTFVLVVDIGLTELMATNKANRI